MIANRVIKLTQTYTTEIFPDVPHVDTHMELQGDQKLEDVVGAFERFLLCCGYDLTGKQLVIIQRAEGKTTDN